MQAVGFLELLPHPGEGLGQGAGGLAGLHHRDKYMVEHLGVLPHGGRHGRALFNPSLTVGNRLPEHGVFRLLGEHLQGIQYRHASVNNSDELAAEYRHIPGTWLLLKAFEAYLGVHGRGPLHRDHGVALAPDEPLGRFQRIRFDCTLDLTSLFRIGDVSEIFHWKLLPEVSERLHKILLYRKYTKQQGY